MQLADRIFIIAKGVLFVRIIDKSLLLNHSPSEWFSLYKKGDGRTVIAFLYVHLMNQRSMSTLPLMPGTLPLSVYCHMAKS